MIFPLYWLGWEDRDGLRGAKILPEYWFLDFYVFFWFPKLCIYLLKVKWMTSIKWVENESFPCHQLIFPTCLLPFLTFVYFKIVYFYYFMIITCLFLALSIFLFLVFLKDIWFFYSIISHCSLNLNFSWKINLVSLSYLVCHQMDVVLLHICFISPSFCQWIGQDLYHCQATPIFLQVSIPLAHYKSASSHGTLFSRRRFPKESSKRHKLYWNKSYSIERLSNTLGKCCDKNIKQVSLLLDFLESKLGYYKCPRGGINLYTYSFNICSRVYNFPGTL